MTDIVKIVQSCFAVFCECLHMKLGESCVILS